MMKQLIKHTLNQVAGRLGWSMLKRGENKLAILMYHRVLPVNDPRYQREEPGMVVSDKTFAMHMHTLHEEQIPVMTVTDWLKQPDTARVPLTVAITFDDGWLDNYQYAFPVLKSYGFPSTLYVVTDFLGQPAPFWPNRVLNLLLDGNQQVDEHWQPLLDLIGQPVQPPLSRDHAAQIINDLKQYTDDEIYSKLEHIPITEQASPEMISAEQLLEAQQHMLVTVGSHTRRHYRLKDNMDEALLREEVVEAKDILETLTGRAVDSFCFPNGDFSDAAYDLVSQHYSAAVTTLRGINKESSLVRHRLLRIGVHNDISDTPLKFKAKLANVL